MPLESKKVLHEHGMWDTKFAFEQISMILNIGLNHGVEFEHPVSRLRVRYWLGSNWLDLLLKSCGNHLWGWHPRVKSCGPESSEPY